LDSVTRHNNSSPIDFCHDCSELCRRARQGQGTASAFGTPVHRGCNEADARSEIERKSVHEWFTGTCYHRLEKDGKIILINHRMHQDDLSGRLLAQQAAGGDQNCSCAAAIRRL